MFRRSVAALCPLGLAACTGWLQPATPVGPVVLLRDVRIPANRAHTVFQDGRQVSGATIERPFCELEIETVSDTAQRANAGIYRVERQSFALLSDPTTRLPAMLVGIDCTDPVFQESLWLLGSDWGGNLHSLRCLRPGFHCRIGPPIELSQVSEVLGSGVLGQSEPSQPVPVASRR